MKHIMIKISDGADFKVQVVARRLAEIFEAVVREREFQTEKYGPVVNWKSKPIDASEDFGQKPGTVMSSFEYGEQGPGGHELGAWLLVIEKELNEAKEAATGHGLKRTGRHSVRSEILQVMATCCAALEQWGTEEVEVDTRPKPGSVFYFCNQCASQGACAAVNKCYMGLK